MSTRCLHSVLAVLALAGCSSPPAPADGGAPPTADAGLADVPLDGDPPRIEWEPCPSGFRDDCATLAMPLDHDDPDGETIDVFISRRGHGPRQLWLLQGGPGGSAEVFDGLHDFLSMVDPELEVYTIEHRGVGSSTRLGCSAEGADTPRGTQITLEEWPACRDEVVAEWGERLAFFSSTQAAHDLALAIERTRRDDQEVFVYGGSYGTLWANRFAVLHPGDVDGVILDAPFQPGATSELYDLQFEPVGRRVFGELCPEAERCAEHLGPDPVAFLERTFENLAAGHCSELGVDLPTWRAVFGVSLMDYNLRNWLPALVYRLDRCSIPDVRAIAELFSNIFGGGPLPRRSDVLQVNVLLSEMWPAEHVDDSVVVTAAADAMFYQNAVAAMYLLQDSWPRYEVPRATEYAPPSIPFLTLAGEDDPATPPAITGYGYRDHLTGPHQTFVEIPFGAHTVLTGGPLAEPPSCSVRLVRAFLADPTANLPVDCATDVLPPSFDAPPDLTMRYWGTTDLYD